MNRNIPLQPPDCTPHLSSSSSQLFNARKRIATAVDIHSVQAKKPSPDKIQREYDDIQCQPQEVDVEEDSHNEDVRLD